MATVSNSLALRIPDQSLENECGELLHLSGSMFCLRRKLKSNSVTIHKNLIVAIFIAELTFLIGINRTQDQVNALLNNFISGFAR